jgi:hypothetical protein
MDRCLRPSGAVLLSRHFHGLRWPEYRLRFTRGYTPRPRRGRYHLERKPDVTAAAR